MSEKRILIAEDDKPSAELLYRILKRDNYIVDVTENGNEALGKLKEEKYDALLTDWIMPTMDGIELIQKVRSIINPTPIIMMITAMTSNEARIHALQSGADSFLGKPYDPGEVIRQLKDLFLIQEQKLPKKIDILPISIKKASPFIAICIAASSGGPSTIKTLLREFPQIENAAFFIVQHAPEWILSDMAISWDKQTIMNIRLGEDGMEVKPGNIYLAPGDKHMVVTGGTIRIKLLDGPSENNVKPAADPLFRSIAKTFGNRSIAVVLTGMGCDGAIGAIQINAVKGTVIAQDPNSAVVYAMPQSVINAVPDTIVAPLDTITETIIAHIYKQMGNELNNRKI